MKRIVALLIILSLLVLICAGCAMKGNCDNCGQYEKLSKFTFYDGSTMNLCDDCRRMYKLLQ